LVILALRHGYSYADTDAVDALLLPGHLYPTDPGCWATVDGTKYGQKLHEVAAEVGDFIIKEDWHVIRTETDADGWEYGIDFPTLMWYPEVAGKKRCKLSLKCSLLYREGYRYCFEIQVLFTMLSGR
jgi:hypothetical protein